MLNGYKTKLTILATILYAITGFVLTYHDANTAVMMIMAAVAGYGLYDKIDRGSKVDQKPTSGV